MEIRIGKSLVGDGHPTFIVAEMSGNHGGKLEQAIEIVRAAKRVGADAIKLQTYTADTITLKSDRDDFRIPSDNPWSEHRTLWDLYNEAYTPWEWHAPLFEEAKKLGIEIFSSPFDESAVDFLEQFDPPAYKIASPEITHIPLLKKVAATKKPVILSTGIAELADIELAVSTLREAGVTDIIVLQCSTSYPAPPEESNLLTIPDLKSKFGVLSGLSDHSMGTAVCVASVVLGGDLIEKHIALEDKDATVDSFFSSGEREFDTMVKDIRIAEQALGSVSYEIAASARINIMGRRSLYVAEDIKAGDTFSEKNIKCVRPSFGLHPRYFDQVIGQKATVDLKKGDRMSLDFIA